MINRRIVATLSLAAVLWVALWPLITSVHASVFGQAMPLCHQAGMQVGADEPAMDMQSRSRQPGKQHCPLCIMAFLAMSPAPAVIAPDRIAPADLAREFHARIHPADLSTRLGESRAPPRPVIPA